MTVQASYIPLIPALTSDPEALVFTLLPPAGASMRPCKEPAHRLIEIAERLLLHRLGTLGQPWVIRPRGGELPGLLHVARRGLSSRTPPCVLFDREVPHVTGVRAVPQQGFLLLRSRVETISGHSNILTRGCTKRRGIHETVHHYHLRSQWRSIGTLEIR